MILVLVDIMSQKKEIGKWKSIKQAHPNVARWGGSLVSLI